MTETKGFTLTGYNGTPTTATVTVQSFNKRERVQRALKGLAKFWVAALGSVFIPVAHFVLVPSFLLFGAYTFFERYTAHQVATAAEGVCPDCGRQQKLDTSGRWRVPRDIACRYCQRSLRLS